MKIKSILAGAAALALTVSATAPVAQPQTRLSFDAAETLAERMVVCDTALFLNSRPNFNANRMFAVRRSQLPNPDLLLPPYFIGPDRWYDEDLSIASDRLRARGRISYAELNAAFDKFAQPVLERYVNRSQAFTVPRADIRRQANICSRFARDLRLGRI